MMGQWMEGLNNWQHCLYNWQTISFKKGDVCSPLGGAIYDVTSHFQTRCCPSLGCPPSPPGVHQHPPGRDFFRVCAPGLLGAPRSSLPLPPPLGLGGFPSCSCLCSPTLIHFDLFLLSISSVYSYYEEATHLSTNMEIFQRKGKWQE